MDRSSNSFLLLPLDVSELLFRLAIALLVGAIVGFEREVKDKSAGLRTHMLVSLGAAFFVLIPIQLEVAHQSVEALSRVLQGIIAGIGFVGGGVILRNQTRAGNTEVKGLTTASAIWVSCGLGVAAGCGLWIMALVGAVLSLMTLAVIKPLERN
ncbi:MAG TPA: MgtC/SapB family protein [Crinalium sp.]|jgi:putative Mg2+ transporter-C (MgtC) family protein